MEHPNLNKEAEVIDQPHIIPEITNELGKHWRQPDRKMISMYANCAIMNKKTFDTLTTYNASIPIGVYEGKMWKAVYQDGSALLLWYGFSEKPNTCKIFKRNIILSNAEKNN